MSSKVVYSVVVPTFNSSDSLTELVKRLTSVFSIELKESFEIIFVDDGSINVNTWATLKALAENNPLVRSFRLTKNFGKSAAVLCGFSQAKGEYVFTIDDDLQHAPEDLLNLVKYKDHDVVIGCFSSKKHSLLKRFASNIKGEIESKILNKPREIKISPVKLYKRIIIDQILKVNTPFPFITALIFMVTNDVVNVPINHLEREHGETGFTFFKMLKSFSNLMINNSSFLLRLIAYLGGSFSLFSVGLGIYFLIRKFLGLVNVSGWTSLVLINLFIGGVLLFAVGVIGEYLIRIIHTVENRPLYFIRESTDEE